MIIPDDMIEACGHIFAGEYDIEYQKRTITILDIGANIGAFAVWATYKWPNANIFCYEPIDMNYEYLIKNTADKEKIKCFNVAVGANEERCRHMYYGRDNRGQCSFYKSPEQRDHGTVVNVIPAADLPAADIVKLDVEGAEIEILENIKIKPDIYLIEYHSPAKRVKIAEILSDYTLVESKMGNLTRGGLKYIKTETIVNSVSPEHQHLIYS